MWWQIITCSIPFTETLTSAASLKSRQTRWQHVNNELSKKDEHLYDRKEADWSSCESSTCIPHALARFMHFRVKQHLSQAVGRGQDALTNAQREASCTESHAQWWKKRQIAHWAILWMENMMTWYHVHFSFSRFLPKVKWGTACSWLNHINTASGPKVLTAFSADCTATWGTTTLRFAVRGK